MLDIDHYGNEPSSLATMTQHVASLDIWLRMTGATNDLCQSTSAADDDTEISR